MTTDIPWLISPADIAFSLFLAGFDTRRLMGWEQRAYEAARWRYEH